jgi:uncharacterized protein with von Willebrand factor type A (vWA) domain
MRINVRETYNTGAGGTTPVLDAVLRFVAALRRAGVGVSMVESLDAAEALRHVDLAEKEDVHTVLAATLVKKPEDYAVFDRLFEVAFLPSTPVHEALAGDDHRHLLADADLQSALLVALERGDRDALRALAALAVTEFGGMEERTSNSEHYFLYRVQRRLDLSAMLQRALRVPPGDDTRSALERRLDTVEQRRRMEEFRRMLSTEVRRRLAEEAHEDRVAGARRDVPPDPADIAFVEASRTELAAMRDAIRPLARRLAARLATRRRSARRGRLDVRRTIRRCLSYGGVPIDLALRRPKAHRPDLLVLCDVSGSVAEFARFLLTLLHALHQELPRIRSFAFVDGVDEVTALLEESPGVLDAHHLVARTEVVGEYGHSDYGVVLDRFLDRFGDALLPTTTVVVAGDARTNYREPNAAALKALRSRVRRLYWFNPEPQAEWDTTDSVMSEYTPWCDEVFEVGNLRQLEGCIYRIS